MRKRQKKTGRPSLPAYLTVEAALVLPLVLALFALLIRTGSFLEDRCLAMQDAYRAAYLAADSPEGKISAGAAFAELAGQGPYTGGRPGAEEAGGPDVILEGRVSLTACGGWGPWRISLSAPFRGRAARLDPPKTIRRLRRLAAMAKGGMGND